jgi:hypothetical protein
MMTGTVMNRRRMHLLLLILCFYDPAALSLNSPPDLGIVECPRMSRASLAYIKSNFLWNAAIPIDQTGFIDCRSHDLEQEQSVPKLNMPVAGLTHLLRMTAVRLRRARGNRGPHKSDSSPASINRYGSCLWSNLAESLPRALLNPPGH